MTKSVATLAFLLLMIFEVSPVRAVDPTPKGSITEDMAAREFEDILENREHLGLNSDPAFVRSLMQSVSDVGSRLWGIPMTASENELVDLPGRAELTNKVAFELLPALEASKDFGGLWVDGPSGDLIVGLTDDNLQVQALIGEVLRDDAARVHVVRSSHSWRRVEDAMLALRPLWDTTHPDVPLGTARAHPQDSSVIAEVAASDLSQALTFADSLEAELGVPVRIVQGEPELDVACMSRTSCWDPFRAGMQIQNNFAGGGGTCTMGFHMTGGAYSGQFITAGHCGAAYTPTDWWHQGNGGTFVGNEIATLLLPTDGVDAMRIDITPESYADAWILGSITYISAPNAYRNPVVNETLCAVLGYNATAIKCGKVTDAAISWVNSTTGYTVHGADLNITTVLGDSGSPIRTPQQGSVIAVGINNTAGAHFARMNSIMSRWPNPPGFVLVD